MMLVRRPPTCLPSDSPDTMQYGWTLFSHIGLVALSEPASDGEGQDRFPFERPERLGRLQCHLPQVHTEYGRRAIAEEITSSVSQLF